MSEVVDLVFIHFEEDFLISSMAFERVIVVCRVNKMWMWSSTELMMMAGDLMFLRMVAM